MKDVFGIDLGTTNSCISIIDDNNLSLVLKNLDDEFTTPSVVYYDEDDEPYVGKEAKANLGNDPDRAVAFIKREMSNTNYRRKIGSRAVSPIEVSALILKKLVDDANELREEQGLTAIHRAVVTVPAYFGNGERENTRQAGEIAGLEILELINEPTAAALSYGTKDLKDKTMLMYDLGGGTFDVSIMHMKNGEMETLATEGNHHLGGIDWDIALIDYVLANQGLDISYDDIKADKEAGKMLLSAEICKKKLSDAEESTFKFIYKRKQYMHKVSKSIFEELTTELMDKTIDLVQRAISIAQNPSIDVIILVGGSSYMPMVKKRLQKEFNIPIILDRFEPDLAIAKGAAIRAAQLAGETALPVSIVSDKGSRSYGTSIMDNGVSWIQNMILRTEDMVVRHECTFFTHAENQSCVRMDIYENVSTEEMVTPNKCTLLRDETIDWNFSVPKGTAIKVVIDRGTDGIVNVWAECQGKEISFDIKPKALYSTDKARELKRDFESRRV